MDKGGVPACWSSTNGGATTSTPGTRPQTPAERGKVKARVLVLTGADDPMIPPEQVEAFKSEMTAAGAKFEVVSFPGAKHSFTNPQTDKTGMDGLAYNADVDRKSWAAMLDLRCAFH